MYRIFSILSNTVISALLLLPFYAVARRKAAIGLQRLAGLFLFSLYLCAVYSVVGLPDICYVRFAPNINLVPFHYFFSDFIQNLLNILLFLPLGLFLPFLWTRYNNVSPTIVFGLMLSVLIELLQLFTYRATDINDLITNTLGSLLGWCLWRVLLYPSCKSFSASNCHDLCFAAGFSWIVMFFLHPFLRVLFMRSY